MKLIVLGMLLAVMQTAPPVPRHTADKASSSGQGVKNHANDKETPAPSPTPTPEIAKPKTQNNGADTPHNPNAQQSMAISELPPVSVEKDWMDKTAWLFGALLILIGAAGVYAAVKTLKAIEKQAGLMEGQLKEMQAAGGQVAKQIAIAEDNIKLIISKERARLRLEPIDLKLPDEFTPLASVEYKVRLYGTDAIIRTTLSDAIISDSEDPPKVTPLSSLFIPAIISPSDSPFTNYQLVTPEEWENIPEVVKAVYNRKKFVHFWGTIIYDDLFGNHYYANFRFVWYLVPGVTRGGKPHGRWDKCGPPEDNRAT